VFPFASRGLNKCSMNQSRPSLAQLPRGGFSAKFQECPFSRGGGKEQGALNPSAPKLLSYYFCFCQRRCKFNPRRSLAYAKRLTGHFLPRSSLLGEQRAHPSVTQHFFHCANPTPNLACSPRAARHFFTINKFRRKSNYSNRSLALSVLDARARGVKKVGLADGGTYINKSAARSLAASSLF
jgi:hypothetical protein